MKDTVEQQILKDLIARSGLSQRAFAKKHGLHEVKLSTWVLGKFTPRSATLEIIAMDQGYEIEMSYELKPLKQK